MRSLLTGERAAFVRGSRSCWSSKSLPCCCGVANGEHCEHKSRAPERSSPPMGYCSRVLLELVRCPDHPVVDEYGIEAPPKAPAATKRWRNARSATWNPTSPLSERGLEPGVHPARFADSASIIGDLGPLRFGARGHTADLDEARVPGSVAVLASATAAGLLLHERAERHEQTEQARFDTAVARASGRTQPVITQPERTPEQQEIVLQTLRDHDISNDGTPVDSVMAEPLHSGTGGKTIGGRTGTRGESAEEGWSAPCLCEVGGYLPVPGACVTTAQRGQH